MSLSGDIQAPLGDLSVINSIHISRKYFIYTLHALSFSPYDIWFFVFLIDSFLSIQLVVLIYTRTELF